MRSLKDLIQSPIEELVEYHMEIAKSLYNQNKEYKPLVIGYAPDKRIKVPLDFADDYEKEMRLRAITIAFLSHGVTSYTVANEGYSLESKSMEEYDKLRNEGKRISDHPDHVEVLLCIGVSEDKKMMRVYKIDPETRELSYLSEMSDEAGAAGRFTELLPDMEIPEETKAEVRALDIAQIGGVIENIN